MLEYMDKYCESIRQDSDGTYIAVLKPKYAIDGMKVIRGDAAKINTDGWVTINGAHVLIDDKTFKVIGGAGGKFNGKVFTPGARKFFGGRQTVKRGRGIKAKEEQLKTKYQEKRESLVKKQFGGFGKLSQVEHELKVNAKRAEYNKKFAETKLLEARDRLKKYGAKAVAQMKKKKETEIKRLNKEGYWEKALELEDELKYYTVSDARRLLKTANQNQQYYQKLQKKYDRYKAADGKLKEQHESNLSKLQERNNKRGELKTYAQHRKAVSERKQFEENLKVLSESGSTYGSNGQTYGDMRRKLRVHINKKYSDPEYAKSAESKELDNILGSISNSANAIRDPKAYGW